MARGLPAAVTLAARDEATAAALARALGSATLRPYHSNDVRGVEIGGAAKNVLAIAAGIVAGRGLGASAAAAVVTRGFAELFRFGRAFGARAGDVDRPVRARRPDPDLLERAVAQLFASASRSAKAIAAQAGGKLAEGIFTAPVAARDGEREGHRDADRRRRGRHPRRPHQRRRGDRNLDDAPVPVGGVGDSVTRGLDPRVHLLRDTTLPLRKKMDGRVKSGNDGRRFMRTMNMATWLLKTEPEEFSWDDQVKRGAKGEAWTGVRNFTARRHLKEMKKGEHAFFYHTGDEKQVVGVVEVIRESYHDPTDEKGVFLAVDVKAVKPFPKPVTLAAIKAEPRLKEMALAKYPRLSVQPVTAQEWKIVCTMGGLKE